MQIWDPGGLKQQDESMYLKACGCGEFLGTQNTCEGGECEGRERALGLW